MLSLIKSDHLHCFKTQPERASPVTYIVLICALILLGMYLYFQKQLSDLRARSQKTAQKQFEAWRDRELEKICADQRAVARREADAEKQEWLITNEAVIRADAIMRSQATITGRVTENIIPYMPVFPYNPKDVRFVGSPVDLIVFDGAAEGALRDVIFLEVKTGNSSLAPVQRQIRDAVTAGRVQWRELRVKSK
jgi:predicted Holliday junction resolvase-like endonuclease